MSLEQSPELRGFRLGMSLSEIKNRFSRFPTVSANELGVATVEISDEIQYDVLNQRQGDEVVSLVPGAWYREWTGAKAIKLKLLDGRLIEITVFYPKDINWKSADEFAEKTGQALKLNGSWKKIGEDSDYSEVRSLQCGDITKGFRVSAGFRRPDGLIQTKLPYVQLRDFMNGEMEVFKRKREIEEKGKREEEERKQIFKP